MEADTVSRYRSRILREMNANRDNPFNSPPSSTGSHGTVSPTLSSVFSDPDGESTRRLNEDIARVTAPRKLPVNWEAAHRKWPEFFGMPKASSVPVFEDNTDTRPLSAESKENKPPLAAAKFVDDSTQDTWMGSNRTRAEMQPRVDDGSDLSSILSKSPGRGLGNPAFNNMPRNPSPLAKVQSRVPSATLSQHQQKRRDSVSEAVDRLRTATRSPRNVEQKVTSGHNSPQMSSAKSSLTAVPPSPETFMSPSHNDTHVRSFFMPDVSHLGDFVTGTLKFSGSMRNGVPIFVKNGKVHDKRERPSAMAHAEVDAVEVPEDEEKIFVSMDMIREEIISLQEHYDKISEYAESLQQQVELLQAQLKSGKFADDGFAHTQANDQLMTQKNRLEVEVATLQSRLEQASRKISLNAIENDAITQEKDRAVRKLQEACEDINKLTRKLNVKEKELDTTHKQLESTEQIRQANDTLKRDLMSIKHGRDSLELENKSLKADNDTLRREQRDLKEEIESLRSDGNGTRREYQSLLNENRSLRASNKTLMDEVEDLRDNLDGAQHEVDAAKEEVETLQQEIQTVSQEKSTLREDNSSLVRHNEKYFSENKVLRRENSGFERSIHDLHDENMKLKEQVEFLKQQLDHCRPLPKEDISAQLNEETEENMTSAFFIPDITINTNESAVGEHTETKDLPDLTETDALPTIPDVTEQETRNTTKVDNTNTRTEKRETEPKTKTKSRSSSAKSATQSQKVAFSIPEKSSRKSSSNVANKGSKRRTVSQSSQRGALKDRTGPTVDDLNEIEETTGLQSMDDTTQDQSMSLNIAPKSRKEGNTREKRQYTTTQEITSHSQKSQITRSHSRSSNRRASMTELTTDSVKTVGTETCPALSTDARRVLDGLCEHNCRNCIVCSRITSHRGVISSADIARGKKRVTVPRPIPVTDRDLTLEDPTMRPSQSPGYALALVIKGLEDEAHHMQLQLSRLQAKYNSSDKSLGRRERLNTAEAIRTLLKQLEVKNDQIYSLYDVLEGQKAAGQAMTEEEVEMTVFNITGLTIRDVTSGSDQLTWEGIVEV